MRKEKRKPHPDDFHRRRKVSGKDDRAHIIAADNKEKNKSLPAHKKLSTNVSKIHKRLRGMDRLTETLKKK